MGVPLLLTWLRSNFGNCITYVAPRNTLWGRKRANTNSNSETPSPLPSGARPRISISGAKRTNAASTVDNLYIDLNSLLYQSVTMVVERGLRDAEAAGQRAAHLTTALSPSAAGSASPKPASAGIGYETETKILAQLVVLLDELLMMTNPTSLIYIAVDGVSPKGKMSQQRVRRANTVKKGFHHKIKSLLGWDSNAITSGTLFMQRVTHVLHYYAVSRVERSNGHGGAAALGPNGSFSEVSVEDDVILDIAMDRAEKAAIFRDRDPMRVIAPGVTFVINDVRIAGEGEHKIIDAIRSFREVKTVLELGTGPGGGRAESNGEEAAIAASHFDATVPAVITPMKHVNNQRAEESEGEKPPPYALFQYNPNTTHCIVSPDTDVVVCSLSLHEPHMTVFWYNGQDSEDSQFFDMFTFRQMLKRRLGFNDDLDDPERAMFFEESLHDVIFILLLFGNDFLPKASALTDIGEGQLDKLLAFFVTDFVSRKRHIVDARTGRIDFAAARYIIDFAVNSEFQAQVSSVKCTIPNLRGQSQYGNKSYSNSNSNGNEGHGNAAAGGASGSGGQGNRHISNTTGGGSFQRGHTNSNNNSNFKPHNGGYTNNNNNNNNNNNSNFNNNRGHHSNGNNNYFKNNNTQNPNRPNSGYNNNNNNTGGGNKDEPFNPFAQGNDVVPGTTLRAGQPQLSEEEIASRCYDYWGGLQWAMLYCTGPCPSWSWQYYHTTVPRAEDLSKYCGMPDDLFDSCFVNSIALSPSKRKAKGAAGGNGGEETNTSVAAPSSVATKHYVGRSDAAMDVIMQLVLLMPFGSRELLPLSIVDSYTKEIAPLITDRPFEEIDLKFVMDWCERQKARLAAADAQRLASFNTDRNPTVIRYQWPAQGIAARMLAHAEAGKLNGNGAMPAPAGEMGEDTAQGAQSETVPVGDGLTTAAAECSADTTILGLGSPIDMAPVVNPFGEASSAAANPFGSLMDMSFGASPFGGGFDLGSSTVASDDDLFGGLAAAGTVTSTLQNTSTQPTAEEKMPPSPAITPRDSAQVQVSQKKTPSRSTPSAAGPEWVRLAGPYHVPYPRNELLLRVLQNQHLQFLGESHEAPHDGLGSFSASYIKKLGGVAPMFTGLVTFFFDFKEDLNAPGMNTVTNVYRCGDPAAEKLCAPMVSLASDWSRHRPCLQVGECREAASAPSSSASSALLSHTMTNTISNANSASSGYLFRKTFLLQGVVQVPRQLTSQQSRKRPREDANVPTLEEAAGTVESEGGVEAHQQPQSSTVAAVSSTIPEATPSSQQPPQAASVAQALEERKRQLALRLAASRTSQ